MSGLINLVASGLLFGAGGPIGGLLARHAGLSPVAVAAYRLAVGGLLIVLSCLQVGKQCHIAFQWLPRDRAAWYRIGAIGLLAASCQGSYFASAALSSVTQATLITIGTAPVLVLAAERVAGARLLGATALALVGLALLVGFPSGAVELPAAGLSVLAAASFAAMNLIMARSTVDDRVTLGFAFAAGGLLLTPVAGAGLAFHPSAGAIALLVLLGALPTGLAYSLYFRGLRRAGASTAAVLVLLEPLSGTLLSALLLGERLSATGIAGAAVLALAMTVAAVRPRSGARGPKSRTSCRGWPEC